MEELSLHKRFEAKRNAYDALLISDWDAFMEARFSEFEDGRTFLVANLDLRHVNFKGFKGDNVFFYECDLRGTNFVGHNAWPLAFEYCDMREMDWRNQHLVAHTFECDMRGIQYDANTKLNWDNVLPSEINFSILDDDFKDFLNRQGVIFDERNISFIAEF